MDRYWLLSNTCYGNWLPGDGRGFVGHVWDHRSGEPDDDLRVEHDIPGTPYDEGMAGLEKACRQGMKGPPIRLTPLQAVAALGQFRETATFRGWSLEAVAVMANHFHIVVGVPGDPLPGKILGDFKSYATRRLSRDYGEPPSRTWWTQHGSKRKLSGDEALHTAVHYVLFKQPHPLARWSPAGGLNPQAPAPARS